MTPTETNSAESEDSAELFDEAAEFVRAAREFVWWHAECGTSGFPRGEPKRAARPEFAAHAESAHHAVAAPHAVAAHHPSATQAAASNAPAPASHSDGHSAHSAPEQRSTFAMPTFDAPVVAPKAAAPLVVLSNEERRAKLQLIDERVKACVACGLHQGRSQTVFSRGDPSAELCFVGEGPGADEDREGLPFVGKAGQLLDKMIQAMGLGPNDVYICNVVKCRPPENRTPEASEMATCLPYLQEQLEVVAPKVIVALGSTALKGLMGPSEGITKARGSWRLFRGKIPLMPTFHPAYVLRQPTREIKGMVWSDLQQVLKHLGRSPKGPGV